MGAQMKVILNEGSPSTENASSVSASTSAPRVTPRPLVPAATPEPNSLDGTQSNALPAGTLQTNVTFRRDAQGQFYYVLTDAQSGREIRQVPPEELRKVGEGIEEFLKQQQAQSISHIKTKA
jgi:hypothetical protein